MKKAKMSFILFIFLMTCSFVTQSSNAAELRWGQDRVLGVSNQVETSRAMGGIVNEAMTIKSISMYLGGSGNVRLAIYAGGTLNNPETATLLWDAENITVNAEGWHTIPHPEGGILIEANTVLWLAWKKEKGVTQYYSNRVDDAGSFQTDRGRNVNNFSANPDVQFPSVYGTKGSFADYWYSIYMTCDSATEPKPVAAFNQDSISGSAPLTVQFSDASQYATQWEWDLNNDGTIDSTIQNPEFTYTKAGRYTVQLTAINVDGVRSQTTSTITVYESGSLKNSTYHVSAAIGNDNWSGLHHEPIGCDELLQNCTDGPWKTLDKVNEMTKLSNSFQPGDQILLKRGEVWFDNFRMRKGGTAESHIVIGAYGDGVLPKLDFSEQKEVTPIVIAQSHVTVENLEIVGGDNAIYMDGASGNEPVILRNLKIHETAKDAIKIVGRGHVTMDNLEVYNSGYDGISVTTGDGLGVIPWSVLRCHYITIKNSKIYNNYSGGIFIAGHYAHIHNNEIYGNGDPNYDADGMGHNIYLVGDNGIVEHNIIRDAAGSCGFRYEGGNLEFRYNYVANNFRHAIGFATNIPDESFTGNRIHNNVLIVKKFPNQVHVPGAIVFTGDYGKSDRFTDNQIYNNTIYGVNEGAIGIGLYTCKNITVKNNIIVTRREAINVHKDDTDPYKDCAAGLVSDHNLLLTTGTGLINYDGTDYDFESWQALGFDQNSHNRDPLFVNETVGASGLVGTVSGLKLQKTSPAINQGANVGLTRDYEGNEIVALPDIGAFETNITTPILKASFAPSSTIGTAPLTVQFKDTSYHNRTDWFWDFGDGQTSNQQDPSHDYTQPGIYRVSLTVFNEGLSSEATADIHVKSSSVPLSKWGQTAELKSYSTAQATRAIGGLTTENMSIQSISMYLGGAGKTRLAIYTGGSLSDPGTARLLWDAGVVTVDQKGWYTLEYSGNDLRVDAGTVVWLAWKKESGVAYYYSTNSENAGDFQPDRGRNKNNFGSDSGTRFPEIYGTAGTFANYWYSVYLSYSVPD